MFQRDQRSAGFFLGQRLNPPRKLRGNQTGSCCVILLMYRRINSTKIRTTLAEVMQVACSAAADSNLQRKTTTECGALCVWLQLIIFVGNKFKMFFIFYKKKLSVGCRAGARTVKVNGDISLFCVSWTGIQARWSSASYSSPLPSRERERKKYETL